MAAPRDRVDAARARHALRGVRRQGRARAATAVPGVEQASVNLATERATVVVRSRAGRPRRAAGGGGRRRLRAGRAPVDRRRRPRTRERAARGAEQDALERRRGRRVRCSRCPCCSAACPTCFPGLPALAARSLGPARPHHARAVLGGRGRSIAASCSDLRHRSASMATLVSIGTSAAYFFSVAVTLWPHALHGRRRHDVLRDGGGGDHPRRARALAGGARARAAHRRPSAGW